MKNDRNTRLDVSRRDRHFEHLDSSLEHGEEAAAKIAQDYLKGVEAYLRGNRVKPARRLKDSDPDDSVVVL